MPNTLSVACVADDLREVDSAEALLDCLAEADAKDVPTTIVGGGSNLVLRARLPGLVVRPRIRGIDVERISEERFRVTLGAGEIWQEAVRATLGRGIVCLENLILIPGSVGAAPVQNIGAYGRELSDVLESVTAIDRQGGKLTTLRAEDCGLSYRSSIFTNTSRYVIVAVTLVLGGGATPPGETGR